MLALVGCNEGSSPKPPAPILSSPWQISYSPNMPSQMGTLGDGTYYFTFPRQDGVHYVTRVAVNSILVGQTITLSFSIEGDGTLVPSPSGSDPGTPPARVRLFLEQAGDTLTAGEEFKRWWSTDSVELKTGDFDLTVPVQPNKWSSVFGKTGDLTPGQLENCLKQLGAMGFTFGGMFAGHGVYAADGSPRFILRSYTVN